MKLNDGDWIDIEGKSESEILDIINYLKIHNTFMAVDIETELRGRGLNNFLVCQGYEGYISSRILLRGENISCKNNITEELMRKMNNVIKPNTKIKILSLEHLKYVKSLAHSQGYKRYIELQSDASTNWLCFFGDTTYKQSYYDEFTKGMKEIFIPMPEDSPKPPFKIRNANHPAVRQWLKDMGYRFEAGYDVTLWNNEAEFGYVSEAGYFSTSSIVKDGDDSDYYDSIDLFNSYSYPELTLNLAVTSWSLPDPVDSAKQERAERIKAIEAELDKLKQMDV